MKHYFIINPAAGLTDATNELKDKLAIIFKDKPEEYDLYVTVAPGDASEQIKKVCSENERKEEPDEYTFYICGGDGSSFEGVNGVYGFKHARLAIIPVGSCNDFLKTFPEYDFLDVESLINGEERLIDVLRVNDFYSINIANVGFDARVNYDCVRLKGKYKTVKKAYKVAIRKNLFRPLGDKVKITADGEECFNGKSLLMAFANGMYYGGGYKCAPESLVDDGLLDMVIVKKVGILTFARLVKYYKRGEHLENPAVRKYVIYNKVKKVTIESDHILCVCIDGETFHLKKVDIEVIPQAIKFVFPKKMA